MPDPDPPAISVATPVKDGSAFLAGCLQSVGGMAEHWVVDGGSTDGTVSILSRPGPHRWISEPDEGQADAVNKGWRRSRGEILGWLNADDLYEPGAIPAVAAFFAAHPGADAAYGDASYMDESGGIVGRHRAGPWRPRRLARVCFVPQPAMFLRRRIVGRLGPLDARWRHCMDYEYWLRLASARAEVRHIPRILARVRLHPAMKTIRERLAVHEEIVRMLADRTGRVAAAWVVGLAAARADAEVEAGVLPGEPRPYALRAIRVVRDALRDLPVSGGTGLRLRLAAWRARARRGRWPFRLHFPHAPALAGRVFGGVRFG